jgi:type I restriction enzyme, R subunit
MSAHAYTEDQLVEQPAIGLFAELGWQTVSALEEMFGTAEPSPGLAATLSHPMGEGASLGRETKGEVVVVFRLRAALARLNPALPLQAITTAVDEFTRELLPPRLLSRQVVLASVSANGAPLYQPGAVATYKYKKG